MTLASVRPGSSSPRQKRAFCLQAEQTGKHKGREVDRSSKRSSMREEKTVRESRIDRSDLESSELVDGYR